MGIFDKIRSGAGLDYLETKKPGTQEKSPAVAKTKKPSGPIKDKQLRAMEYDLQKIIKKLQDIQEKLRVRRGI